MSRNWFSSQFTPRSRLRSLSFERLENRWLLSHVTLNPGDILVNDFLGSIVKVDPLTGSQTEISDQLPLTNPDGIAIDANGDIIVSDRRAFGGSGGIIRIDLATDTLTTVSSGGIFNNPGTVTIDSDGDIIVADFGPSSGGTGSVIRVDPVTGSQTTISTGGNFVDPYAIAFDANGDLIVSTSAALAVRLPYSGSMWPRGRRR